MGENKTPDAGPDSLAKSRLRGDEDTEGHLRAVPDDAGPDGIRNDAGPDGMRNDAGPDGFRAVPDDTEDTEGHKAGFRNDEGPDSLRAVPGDEDTEGHKA